MSRQHTCRAMYKGVSADVFIDGLAQKLPDNRHVRFDYALFVEGSDKQGGSATVNVDFSGKSPKTHVSNKGHRLDVQIESFMDDGLPYQVKADMSLIDTNSDAALATYEFTVWNR